MKKLVLVLFVSLFGFSVVSYAMPPRHEPNFERLAEDLQVSEDQLDSFLAVMKEQHAKRKSIHEQGREAVKGQMEGLRTELLGKLEGILDDNQLSQLKEKMDKRRAEKRKYRMLNAHRGNDCCPNQQ